MLLKMDTGSTAPAMSPEATLGKAASLLLSCPSSLPSQTDFHGAVPRTQSPASMRGCSWAAASPVMRSYRLWDADGQEVLNDEPEFNWEQPQDDSEQKHAQPKEKHVQEDEETSFMASLAFYEKPAPQRPRRKPGSYNDRRSAGIQGSSYAEALQLEPCCEKRCLETRVTQEQFMETRRTAYSRRYGQSIVASLT